MKVTKPTNPGQQPEMMHIYCTTARWHHDSNIHHLVICYAPP